MRGGLVRPRTEPNGVVSQAATSSGAYAQPRVSSTSKPLPADLLIWLVGGSLLAYIWRIQDIFPIFSVTRFSLLVTAGFVGVYLLNEDRRRKLDTVRHPISKTIGVLIVLMAASIPTSLVKGFSFNSLTQDYLRNILLMAILIASVRGFRDLEKYAIWFLVGGVIFSQYVYRKAELGQDGRLIGVAYYDANDVAMLVVFSIPILLYFLVRGRPFVRVFALAALILYVLVFLQSGSRGGFLGIVVVGGYLLLQFHAVSKSARIATISLVAVVMMAFAGDQYWGTIKTIVNPQDDYNMQEDTGRMAIWKRGVGYMLARPITGVGYQAFTVAEGTLAPQASLQVYGVGFKWSTAHNSFVQVGAELGIGGLIVFVVLLWKSFFTARRIGARRDPDGNVPDEAVMGQALAGSIIGFVVCGFFLSQAYACSLLFLLAMIVALDKVCAMNDSAMNVGVARATPFGAGPRQHHLRRPAPMAASGEAL